MADCAPVILLLSFIFLAIVADIVGYFSVAQDERHGYNPNLTLLGAGLLFGLCSAFVILLSRVLQANALNSLSWDQRLLFVLVPGVILVVIVWAVAKICGRE